MTDQPQFLSRRELREAERAGLIEQNELPFDGKPRVDSVEVPTHDTGAGLTRRQLRELEKKNPQVFIKLQGIIGGDLAQKAEQFNDNLTRLGQLVQGAKIALLGDLLPALILDELEGAGADRLLDLRVGIGLGHALGHHEGHVAVDLALAA